MDDTFLILKKDQVDYFTSHINLIDPNIKFTTEPNNKKSSAKDRPIGPSNSSATGRNPFVVLPLLAESARAFADRLKEHSLTHARQ